MKKVKRLLCVLLSVFVVSAMLVPQAVIFADEAVPKTVDLCLDASGNIRGGVKITPGGDFVRYGENDEFYTQNVKEMTQDEIKGMHLENILKNNGTYVYKQAYGTTVDPGYFQIDLGNVRALSEISYKTATPAVELGYTYKIMLSNDPTFSNADMIKTVCDVTQNNEKTNLKTTEPNVLTLDPAADRYQYLRIQASAEIASLNADYLSIKGYDEIYPQDIIHDAKGDIWENVNVTFSGTAYTGYAVSEEQDNGLYAEPKNTIDNKYSYTYNGNVVRDNIKYSMDPSSATSFISDNKESGGYIQLDLGETKIISELKVLPFQGAEDDAEKSAYYRSGLKILASKTSDFSDAAELTSVGDTALDRGKWIEYTSNDLTAKYRYIRIIQADRGGLMGITEIQAQGYNICDAEVLSCNVADKRITNIKNNSMEAGYTYAKYIELEFSDDVDPESVSAKSVVLSSANPYTPIVEGNKIKIDTACLPYYTPVDSAIKLNVTSEVTCGGLRVLPYEVNFQVALNAPIPQEEGKDIYNIAKGKIADVPELIDQEKIGKWNNTVLIKGQEYKIDLVESCDIQAIGWYINSAHHLGGLEVYASNDAENLKQNLIYTVPSRDLTATEYSKLLDTPVNARYVTLVPTNSETYVVEFCVYSLIAEPKVVSANIAEGAVNVTNVARPEVVYNAELKTVKSTYIGKPLELTFSGEVDASTVSKDTVKISCHPLMGYDADYIWRGLDGLNYEPVANGNKISVDLAEIIPYSDVTVTVTDGVTVNGLPIEEYTLHFTTSPEWANVPYKEGKKIVNAAYKKAAWYDNIKEGTKVSKSVVGTKTAINGDAITEGCTVINDNNLWDCNFENSYIVNNNTQGKNNLVIDLGSEYEVAGYGWATQFLWHFTNVDFYVSSDINEVGEKNGTSRTSNWWMQDSQPATKNVKGRYVTMEAKDGVKDGDDIHPAEVMVYAYADADEKADVYFTTDIETGKIKANAEFAENQNGVLLVALYNSQNVLVNTAVSSETEGVRTVEVEPNGCTVKAFVFESMDNLKPVCAPVTN